ncbi:MAG TPA: J domain-containing protein [Chthonomonadales bacterium]|nr:J domain-containing protein [Chthonomonadales bacterium]
MNGPQYKDYYKILGVPRDASAKDIRAAFRRLARKYHPDVNPGDRAAEERFKEISEAHDILSDQHKRTQYDSFGEQWRRSSQGGWPATAGGFEFQGGGLSDLGELFEGLFGGGGRRQRTARTAARGEDVEFGIDLTLEEAAHGATKSLELKIQDACPRCGGTGGARTSRGGFDIGAACSECRGHGRVLQPRRVEVKIPTGVVEGQRIRLAAQGAAGAGGDRGDLFLVVRVRPHADFEAQGNDLYTDVSIPYTVAALGGEVEVKTLMGVRTLPIPAGVQSGQRIRVAGQGIGSASGKRGDLYARVRITVPRDLSPRERSLLAELSRLRGEQANA